ncbi:MAG TPA: carboxymuconolactone decarboxylase family protein [Methylomirabilota bacterium]|jgi:AhpD family alkylhydroperoxidase|nr:carboxymuconolactone decarboxylase family protein [Methylomirabilota bacterium]
MALLKPLTREEVAADLLPLWDACERAYPDFHHLWATMAHSPIVFSHVWGQLLALKRESPVHARHFEIAILVVSNATRCDYCIAHHTPRALGTGLSAEQVAYLAELPRTALGENERFEAAHPGFGADDSLVIDLARFVVWSGLQAPAAGVHPRVVHRLRRRLFDRLAAAFSPRQLEELVWRTTQCAAFNWHNELLELDLEPEVAPPAEHR